MIPGTANAKTLGQDRPPVLLGDVLIVEDDADLCEGVADLLRDEGYDVATAANGLEAMEHLRGREPPGLIVLDLRMPVMDGWALRAELRKDPALGRVPIVLLSGTNDAGEQARALGAVGYVTKPFGPEVLLRAAHAALDRMLRRWMTAPVITVGPGTTAAQASRLAESCGVHHLPVVASNRVVGVVCGCNLGRATPDAPVSSCMSRPAITVDESSSASEAARLMEERSVGCLPVLRGSTLVGFVAPRDLRNAGALEEKRMCSACGATYHLRSLGDAEDLALFCRDCVESAHPHEFYGDIGGGD